MSSTVRRRRETPTVSEKQTPHNGSPAKPTTAAEKEIVDERPRTRRGRITLTFLLGSLFGLFLAWRSAKRNDLLRSRFPEFWESSLESLSAVLPEGLVNEVRDLVVCRWRQLLYSRLSWHSVRHWRSHLTPV